MREQLIRLHRVTAHCLYAAADVVIPCNATFNTKWEVRSTSGGFSNEIETYHLCV